MAERQRQSATCGYRKNVLEYRERAAVAQSDRLVRFGTEDGGKWRIRCENDWPLRICATGLLAGGHKSGRRLRIQHGNQPGAGDSDSGIAGKINPQRASLANRRRLELSRGWPALHDGQCFYRWFD